MIALLLTMGANSRWAAALLALWVVAAPARGDVAVERDLPADAVDRGRSGHARFVALPRSPVVRVAGGLAVVGAGLLAAWLLRRRAPEEG